MANSTTLRGAFTNAMTYHLETDTWTFLLREKEATAIWTNFAEETFKHAFRRGE